MKSLKKPKNSPNSRIFYCSPIAASDRVLRPMILTKQLELQDDYQPYVATTVPRTGLAKELEKYNRPPVDFTSGPIYLAQKGQNLKLNAASKDVGIERPNILSKRPHFKPQFRYDSQPINLSKKDPPKAEDLSMKGQQMTVLKIPRPQMHQDKPMDLCGKPATPSATHESLLMTSLSSPSDSVSSLETTGMVSTPSSQTSAMDK